MEKFDDNKCTTDAPLSMVKVQSSKMNNNNNSESTVKSFELPAPRAQHSCLERCSDKDNCLSLNDILRSFNAPLSEDQAWSLIYQSVRLYRDYIHLEFIDRDADSETTTQKNTLHRIKVPKSTRSLNIHKDGYVHISDNGEFTILCAKLVSILRFTRWSNSAHSTHINILLS